MPRLILPIRDVDETVIRPIVTDVMKDLFLITNIAPDTKIYFPGSSEQVMQNDSPLGFKGEKNRFGVDGYVYIEVSARPIEDLILTNSYDKPAEQFTFFDKDLNIFARPSRVFSEIEISIRYRSRSKVDGKKWQEDLLNKVSQGRNAYVHKPVTYSYDIPFEAIQIFKELHRLRENKHGYGDDFEKWFLDRSSKFVTVITNQVGDEHADEYTVRENLERVQGMFDFTITPSEGQFVDGSSAWEYSLNYTIQLDIVQGYILLYPVIVHNQLLGPDFIEYETQDEQFNYRPGFNLGGYYTHVFEAANKMALWKTRGGISIPSHDDFQPKSLPGLLNIMTILIRLNEPGEGDPLELLDFSNLGKYKLADSVIEFLEAEYRYLTRTYKSIIHLDYYRGDQIIWEKDNVLNPTKDGRVLANRSFDPRLVHHIRMSFVYDLTLLDMDALDRLRCHPDVFMRYLKTLWPNYDLSTVPIRKTKGGCPIPVDFLKTLKDMDSMNMRTVGTYSVDGFFDPDFVKNHLRGR